MTTAPKPPAEAQADPSAPVVLEAFVVRDYIGDDGPSIKGNGFDGLRIGEDRYEAEEFIRWINARLAQQPAAVDGACAAATIRFALTDPEGMTFLRLWNEGDFDTLRREWPDAPIEVYVGADPLAAQPEAPTMTSNVKLLPLPEKVEVDKHLPTGVRIYAYDKNTLKDYARANVEAAMLSLADAIEAASA